MGRAFVFAGGGTGGHLFPGLAIAEEISRRVEGARFVYLCSHREIDARILGKAGVEFEPMPARPFSVRPVGLARFIGSWGPTVRAARAALRKAREGADQIDLIALGGFVAAPVVQAARVERVPVTMVNLDAVPGKANRWIARRAGRVMTALPVEGHAWELIGPVVRRAAVPGGDAALCRTRLGLSPDNSTLLVCGGSQGAGSINGMMTRLVETRPAMLAGWQVVHQTGERDVDQVREAYRAAGVRAVVEPFFEAMGDCWGASDLAVSRAGAGSVFEAWASRTATLFMPYPFHRDEHQRHNARPLEAAGGAVIARDRIDPARNAQDAGRVLEELIGDEPRRSAMREALAGLGEADGAGRVAGVVAGR
jgi:UDP-N-acetylglucosamine--N-acetylmuramyl-(pentapeptide) pyrophosphoryl-undecaprenol N-acetylglucosamine transferase